MRIPADKINELVPEQKKGNHSEVMEEFVSKTKEEAVSLFRKAKEKLEDVNRWNQIAEGMSAHFQLLDEEGTKEVNRLILHGFIRIRIPGPGPEEGDGYDWVRIEEIVNRNYEVNEEQFFGFRVRPVDSPTSVEGKPAHMFKDTATSCFMVYRSGLQVVVAQIGNNEEPNTETSNLKDKIRNIFVAFGAIAGFSETQWGNLIKGIISAK